MSYDELDLRDFAVRHMRKARRSGKGYLVLCPFHNDVNNPSMYVTEEYAYCFACGKSYRKKAVIEKIMGGGFDCSDCNTGESKKKIREARQKNISKQFINRAAIALQENKIAMRYMVEKRGIDAITLRKHKIGLAVPPFGKYSVERIMFPVLDSGGNAVTVGYRQCPGFNYVDDNSVDKRYVTHMGTNMYPFNMSEMYRSEKLVYAGGQIDCLTLLSAGIPSIGSMGEGVFKKEWAEMLSLNRLFILLDNDKAGWRGAEKVSKMIPGSTIVRWTKKFPVGCDINSIATNSSLGMAAILELLYDTKGYA